MLPLGISDKDVAVSMVDPDGNETTQAQLRAYFFIVQFARGLAADRGENVRAEFYRLLSG